MKYLSTLILLIAISSGCSNSTLDNIPWKNDWPQNKDQILYYFEVAKRAIIQSNNDLCLYIPNKEISETDELTKLAINTNINTAWKVTSEDVKTLNLPSVIPPTRPDYKELIKLQEILKHHKTAVLYELSFTVPYNPNNLGFGGYSYGIIADGKDCLAVTLNIIFIN